MQHLGTSRRAMLARTAQGLAAGMLPWVPSPTGQDTEDGAWGLTNVLRYGARGDGSTDDTPAIHRAALASPGGALLFPGQRVYTIAQGLYVKPAAGIVVAPGAQLKIADNVVLQLRSMLFAANTPVFTGPGRVRFTQAGTIMPEWFGASSSKDNDSGPPLQRAIDASARGSCILLSARQYNFDSGVTIPPTSCVTISGFGNGTRLVLTKRFKNSDALFSFPGTPAAQNKNQTLRDVAIWGNNDPAIDGAAIRSDYTINLQLTNVMITLVRNTAISLGHVWDAKLDHIRIFGCGSGRPDSPAVHIGDTNTEGDRIHSNACNANLMTVERSYGVAVHLENAVEVTLSGCKLHGRRPRDVDAGMSQELLRVTNSRHIRLTGCQFAEARTHIATGAVRVEGQFCTVILTTTTFDRIGADDTYAIYYDCVRPASRLILDDLYFNDRRTRTHYVLSRTLPRQTLVMGPAMAFASDHMALEFAE